MKNKITKFFNDLWIGVKLGIKLSLLPESVSKFQNYPLMRILRVIGGISILLVLKKSELFNENLLLYIIFPMAFVQILYIIIINIIKICYYIYLLKNKKLQVKNSPSPLNKTATFALNLVACVKSICAYGIFTGAAISLGVSIDKIL